MDARLSSRRNGDSRARALAIRALGAGAAGRVNAAVSGRVLVGGSMVVLAVTVPFLETHRSAWVSLQITWAILGAGLITSCFVPWARLTPRATLAFPLAVHVALIALGALESATFAPLTGLLALCFAYIGVTQPPGVSLAMLPVAGLVLVFVYGGWNATIGIRVIIACVVWLTLGELLALFTARQARLSEELRTAAHTDALTGVANRRDLNLRLLDVQPGDVIVVCDLDHFKLLNDRYGHDAGDEALANFGTLLRTTIRSGDYCARLGGEEFVVLLPATSELDATFILTRMRGNWALLQPGSTFSAGLATARADRSTADTLQAADRCVYEAKIRGRDRTCTESPVSVVPFASAGRPEPHTTE